MEETGGRAYDQIVVAAVVTAVTVVSLALFIRAKASGGGPRLPPGPRGWPVLGSLPSLGVHPHRALYNLSRQYGPIMFMHLGSVKTLVVTSPQLAEEILKTQDQIMASRPELAIAKFFSYDRIEILWAPYGKVWRNMRKICTVGLLTATRLRQFQGIRKREVLASLHSILEESKELGKAVNMTDCFTTIATNNVTQMIMKKSYCGRKGGIPMSLFPDSTDTFQEIFRELIDLTGSVNFADYLPSVKPFDLQGFDKRAKDLRVKLDKFFQVVMDEHSQKQSSGGETQGESREDFVDVLLAIGSKNVLEEPLSTEAIKAVMLDMLGAASDTSSTALAWTLAELMKQPRLMSRVQEELDSVVGQDRLVTEEDLPELPYLQAVVKESFRLHTPVPLLLPHESTHDCEIAGYHIPARTRVFVNQWGIQRDPAIWERPEEFDPDRFLNSKLDLRGQNFEFCPFGSGRRMCPGMSMGLIMVQYPLALMLHAISWSLPEDQKPQDIDMTEVFGTVCYKKIPLVLSVKARLQSHVIYSAQEM